MVGYTGDGYPGFLLYICPGDKLPELCYFDSKLHVTYRILKYAIELIEALPGDEWDYQLLLPPRHEVGKRSLKEEGRD